uniref:Uncharacterized protein n=1 Tax=Arundo donax TaxID=35708 RepID=A0A0A8YYX1_ARUDO
MFPTSHLHARTHAPSTKWYYYVPCLIGLLE